MVAIVSLLFGAYLFLLILPGLLFKLFIAISITCILIFLTIEYVKNRNLNGLLKKYFLENTISIINKVINILFLIIKISILIFGFYNLVGYLLVYNYLFDEKLPYNIYKVLIASLISPLVIYIILKIIFKKIKYPLNILFFIEPYVLVLILDNMQISK
jgi:hypothetical protein